MVHRDYTEWAKYGTRPTSKGATEISEYFSSLGSERATAKAGDENKC
jgi:hypothetical protein